MRSSQKTKACAKIDWLSWTQYWAKKGRSVHELAAVFKFVHELSLTNVQARDLAGNPSFVLYIIHIMRTLTM
jgi:hypothetical protein